MASARGSLERRYQPEKGGVWCPLCSMSLGLMDGFQQLLPEFSFSLVCFPLENSEFSDLTQPQTPSCHH